MTRSVKTPCIGVCSTVFGDEVCRGCKRFQNEVIDWNSYQDSQKIAVLSRLESLKTQIMESKISIVNKKLLQNQLDTLDIKYVIDDNPFCWVFDLLRQASQSIDSLQDFGVVLKDGVENNLFELKKVIESELFSLSEAHFQRYFKIEKHYRA
ncbi:DUF1289 domain-containing protein [Gammaproteobacteria bacterium]|jgi:hypothetical protein|nr:DUF1289 domain-containing protein [Gammaproteobacteria bacterium]MDC0075939.1 DUF1289 domain-containing protein [Gammaproteobacteria bacterium]|tara:strand:+ start:433 stop:888 length:456 start_codon:yes stop_codon:yes gene_type:complete